MDKESRNLQNVPPTSTSTSRFHAIKSMKPDRGTLPRFWRNLKLFFLDSWFDVLCIIAVTGVAGAVSILPPEESRHISGQNSHSNVDRCGL